MNPNFTLGLNETVCSMCHCKDQKFLHHAWDGEKACKICPSCVPFEHSEFYCSECFDLHEDKEQAIICVQCKSYTHLKCFYSEDKSIDFVCSTCNYLERLIFDLKELKVRNREKITDVEAVKVVKELTSKAYDELVKSAVMRAADAVSDKKMARDAVRRFMKFDESNDGPSLLEGFGGQSSSRFNS